MEGLGAVATGLGSAVGGEPADGFRGAVNRKFDAEIAAGPGQFGYDTTMAPRTDDENGCVAGG